MDKRKGGADRQRDAYCREYEKYEGKGGEKEMKNIRKAYRGEKGFTLVELLVVIVILGILAAVAAVAIMRFMSAGNVSAANEEMHQVKTAIGACMFEGDSSTLDFTGVRTFTGAASVITSGSGAADAASYIDGKLRGSYIVTENGTIQSALVSGGNSTKSWGNKVTWDTTTGGFKKV
jgi:prepilin-type N-terminal cleavage/methylation domain-containing protein